MKEEFLHYVWQYKLFSSVSLKTTNNEELFVIKSGTGNRNSGPDFFNAELKIENQIWIGNIEIHVNASDWYLHKHEEDSNYDAVILHVVWNNDAVVFMKNNQPIPTLELRGFIDKDLLNNYQKLLLNHKKWILCEDQLVEIDAFLLNNWLERLYIERLENKSILIKELLQKSNNDFEAVLFQLIAKNFGLKVNGEAFLRLATSLDFSVVRKVCFKEELLSALLFGQAGFLEEDIEEDYCKELKKEYAYLKHKFKLQPISKNQFSFFRMRPSNFPTIRIAQLISLFSKYQKLFSKLMEIKNLNQFYELFLVDVNDFWKTHYTFKTTSKKSSKKLTKSFVDLLLINTVIPLKFVYEQNKERKNDESIFNLIKQIKPEKNNIISKFLKLNIYANNALETQGLIELKNNYCAKKQCLQCAIGSKLLKS